MLIIRPLRCVSIFHCRDPQWDACTHTSAGDKWEEARAKLAVLNRLDLLWPGQNVPHLEIEIPSNRNPRAGRRTQA